MPPTRGNVDEKGGPLHHSSLDEEDGDEDTVDASYLSFLGHFEAPPQSEPPGDSELIDAAALTDDEVPCRNNDNDPDSFLMNMEHAPSPAPTPVAGSKETEKPKSKFHELEDVMRQGTLPVYPYVFVHKDDETKDKYEDDEMEKMKERDFETRLFISEKPFQGEAVFLQNHFTDNHRRSCNMNAVRDVFKATFGEKIYTAARSTLTELLYAGFNSERSEYYSFAVTLASGLSNTAERTNFQLQEDNRKSFVQGKNVKQAREQLCRLMHLVFTKFRAHKFLLEDGGLNIYRLGHCRFENASTRSGMLRASYHSLFCFLMQASLAVYVVMEMNQVLQELDGYTFTEFNEYRNIEGNGFHNFNLPLCVIVTFYSIVMFHADFEDTLTANEVIYSKWSIFRAFDLIVNIGLHPLVIIAGFVVVWSSSTYIDAVLNSTALLFIVEIDNNFHEYLGSSPENIVENYLVKRSMQELDGAIEQCEPENGQSEPDEPAKKLPDSAKINFCDYYLTNCPEQGTDTLKGLIYQPFRVKYNKKELKKPGHIVCPSSLITGKCLIKKIKWWYTTFKGARNLTDPRIGRLELTLLNDPDNLVVIGENLENNGDGRDFGIIKESEEGYSEDLQTLEGIFIITMFKMSVNVLRLRLCGSAIPKKDCDHSEGLKTAARNFQDGIEHYALWEISTEAEVLLNKILEISPLQALGDRIRKAASSD